VKVDPKRRIFGLVALAVVLAAGMAGSPGCGGEDATPTDPDTPPPAGADTIAPLTTTDLRVRVPTYESVALVWTSPGDDGAEGTAAKYDIRFSRSLITEENWGGAECVDSACVPAPQPGGRIETIILRGLDSGTRYYFALRTSDEGDNCSGVSNCATERTLDESFPPSNVVDLAARAVSSNEFELTWTAPGDDYMSGTADRYDIRYSRYPIVDDADWDAATSVSSPPLPKPSGERESITVEVDVPNEGFLFALKTVDEVNNWSGLSNGAPGLGFDDDLWITPTSVHLGEVLYVSFRPAPGGLTHVSIDNSWITQCCGPTVSACLAEGVYAEGTYSATFDFCDEAMGECLPFDIYWVYLCWDWAERKKIPIHFEP